MFTDLLPKEWPIESTYFLLYILPPSHSHSDPIYISAIESYTPTISRPVIVPIANARNLPVPRQMVPIKHIATPKRIRARF